MSLPKAHALNQCIGINTLLATLTSARQDEGSKEGEGRGLWAERETHNLQRCCLACGRPCCYSPLNHVSTFLSTPGAKSAEGVCRLTRTIRHERTTQSTRKLTLQSWSSMRFAKSRTPGTHPEQALLPHRYRHLHRPPLSSLRWLSSRRLAPSNPGDDS